jgi:predicted restriction endonuclease
MTLQEWSHELEQIDWPLILQTTGLLAMAFSRRVRREVYERQHGNCDCCGEHRDRLQTHHRLPHREGGPDEIENAVGLCQTCHLELDRETFIHLIYPQVHTEDRYYPHGNGLQQDEQDICGGSH